MGLFQVIQQKNACQKLLEFFNDPANADFDLNQPGGMLNLPPLFYTIMTGTKNSLQAAELLLNHGALIQTKDGHYSAMDYVVRHIYLAAGVNLDNLLAFVKLFAQHGVRLNEEEVSKIASQALWLGSQDDFLHIKQSIKDAMKTSLSSTSPAQTELKSQSELVNRLLAVETNGLQTPVLDSGIKITGSPKSPLIVKNSSVSKKDPPPTPPPIVHNPILLKSH